jgi:hypothetical protein
MSCASVAVLLPFKNKKTIHSDQYGSGKHLDWSLELQSCVLPLVNSSLNTDKTAYEAASWHRCTIILIIYSSS